MQIKLNDIFQDNEDYSRYAKYATDNGFIIKELESVNDIRQFQVVEIEKPTFEELKEAKLSELTAITSKFDNQLVNTDMIIQSSLGFKINADLRSQNNLRGLIAVGVEPINFVIADNSVQSLTLEQLNVLLNECVLNGQNIYLIKWQYREQIEQAKTAEELNAIEFNFTETTDEVPA